MYMCIDRVIQKATPIIYARIRGVDKNELHFIMLQNIEIKNSFSSKFCYRYGVHWLQVHAAEAFLLFFGTPCIHIHICVSMLQDKTNKKTKIQQQLDYYVLKILLDKILIIKK